VTEHWLHKVVYKVFIVACGICILTQAKVPQRAIMRQLGMSKATLMRVLAFARANPADPIAKRKKGNSNPTKLTEATLEIMKTKLQKTPMLTAIQLRMRIPELEGISVRTIQRACKETQDALQDDEEEAPPD
jgi:hypothetical protein